MDFQNYHTGGDLSQLQSEFMDFDEYAQVEKNLRLARNKYMQERGRLTYYNLVYLLAILMI